MLFLVILGCYFDNLQVWVIKKIEIMQYFKEVFFELYIILSLKSVDYVVFLYILCIFWMVVVIFFSCFVYVYIECMILLQKIVMIMEFFI